eukprot:6488913-Amphidinium_carterae.1
MSLHMATNCCMPKLPPRSASTMRPTRWSPRGRNCIHRSQSASPTGPPSGPNLGQCQQKAPRTPSC